ncbi:MAG: hypothetical protein NC331_11440 [Lachnospiraceae bacterium]|nr:hypothetical protein [Lachnospiraceae bacterium]MCM1239981.1 hypothetical protein [Lachnospiraceae bacterium]
MGRSIMHDKGDGTCYLCMLLHGDHGRRTVLEEHHVMGGTADRRLSERYGLKVYLCPQHHRIHREESPHQDRATNALLHRKAQEAFERAHSHGEWMEAFGRNYI